MTFDGQELSITEDCIDCPGKKARVYINALKVFMKTKTKMIIGHSTDPQKLLSEDFLLYGWEDADYVHLGCLKESKFDFQHKYIQLIKHLNSQS